MTTCIRAAAVALIAGLFAGMACGGTGSTVTRPPDCQIYVYYGGGAAALPPDGVSACAAGPCNYQAQTGCAAGQTCWPQIDTKNGTVTPTCRAGGKQKRGEACDDQQQCSPGLYCVEKACRTMCCGGDWSACAPGESCTHQAAVALGESTVYAGFDLCFPVGTCDVLDRTSCSSQGQVCRVVDPTGAVACSPPNNLGLGAPCDRLDQCEAGMICAGAAPPEQGTCRHLCRWAACGEPTCGSDEGVCVHFTHDPVGVGECTPDWEGEPVSTDGGVVYGPDGSVLFNPDAGTERRDGGVN